MAFRDNTMADLHPESTVWVPRSDTHWARVEQSHATWHATLSQQGPQGTPPAVPELAIGSPRVTAGWLEGCEDRGGCKVRNTRTELWSTRTEVWCTRAEVWSTRAEVASTRAEV